MFSADREIKLFAFHGSIGTPLISIEEGDFTAEITEAKDGRFSYVNTKETLESGDVVYFWIHVQKGNLGYKKLGQVARILPNGEASETFTIGKDPAATQKPPPRPSTTYIFPSTSITNTNNNDDVKVKDPIDLDSLACSKGFSLTKYNGNVQPCKGDLIFEETFDHLNSSVWQNVIQIPSDNYDADFVSFQSRRQNCFVSAGNLHLVPSLLTEVPGYPSVQNAELDLKKECTATVDYDKECSRQASGFYILPPVVSAKVRTKDSFSFKYGRVVVRAKMPKGDWLFPLITLEPTAFSYGVNSYSSGQIRIASVRGNEKLSADNEEIGGSVLYGGPILDVGEENRNFIRSKKNNGHYGNQFFNFELLWTPNFLRFYVNDVQYGEVKANHLKNTNIQHSYIWANGEKLAPFDKEFHLSLGLSVGGHSEFPQNCLNGNSKKRKPWENNDPKAEFNFWRKRSEWTETWDGINSGLIVDSVKVYALND